MIAFHSALTSSQITTTIHTQYYTQEPGTGSQNSGLLRGDGLNILFRKVISKHLDWLIFLLASLKHRVFGVGGHWKGRGISLRKSQRGSSRAKGLAGPMSSAKARSMSLSFSSSTDNMYFEYYWILKFTCFLS